MADLAEEKDALNDLFMSAVAPEVDEALEYIEPQMVVDIAAIDQQSTDIATTIAQKLADYYFDKRYIEEHPYVSNKIMTVTNSIRRLQKMLIVNEQAQNNLLQSIAANSQKGSLYASLTSLQQATLSIQRQLDDLIKELEDIFRKMQDECKLTFDAKEKDVNDDGSVTSTGSRDFIKQITANVSGQRIQMVDTRTGEVLSTTSNFTVEETPIELGAFEPTV